MNITGHPLVDAGLAIAALHNGKRSISDLSEADLRHTVAYLNRQIDPDKSHPGPVNNLKVLSAFWQNNPLAGHNMGQGGQNVPSYRKFLTNAAEGSSAFYKGICQICGRNGTYIDANRSWFPLSGSSTGDPCSLPNLGGKLICVTCFSAVVILPLGLKFVGNNPYFYHVTDPDIQCQASEIGFNAVMGQLGGSAKGNEELKTKVKLSGRAALLEIVAGSRLWDKYSGGGSLIKRLPTGATIIAFSNAGTSATWQQLHLPAQALVFFAEIDRAEQARKGLLRDTFLKWAEWCEKPEFTDRVSKEKRTNPQFEMLCDDIEMRRSLSLLVRAIVRRQPPTEQLISKEEKQVLEIYERAALNKQERFDLLSRIAGRIRNEMEPLHRDSFRKQLANIRRKDTFLKLLVKYTQSEKTGLRLNCEELRMLDKENAGEVISLLYLLIVAEE